MLTPSVNVVQSAFPSDPSGRPPRPDNHDRSAAWSTLTLEFQACRSTHRRAPSVTARTCRVRGPWTPSTQSSSMSLVADGPESVAFLQNSAHGPTRVIGGRRRSGMIAAVSLRLLYLIFLQVLGLLLMRAVGPHPRTSSCWCCATRSRCFAATTRHSGWTGPTSGLRRPDPTPAREVAWPSLVTRARSCAGTAVSCAAGGPTRPGRAGRRSMTASSRGWWSGWRGELKLGASPDSGRTAQLGPPRRGLDHRRILYRRRIPTAPTRSTTPAGASSWHSGHDDVGRGLLRRRLCGDAAEVYAGRS